MTIYSKQTTKPTSSKGKVKKDFRIQLAILVIGFALPLFANAVIKIVAFPLAFRLPGTEDWIHHAYAIKEGYARSIKDSKKIVIISGSNSLYGLSAKKIERELGLPTVNYAAHAGLGIDFSLYKGKQIINEGDTVILAFEYDRYLEHRRDTLKEQILLNYVVSYEPEYLNSLTIEEKSNAVLVPTINLTTFFDELTSGNLSKSSIKDRIRVGREAGECYSSWLNANGDELCNTNNEIEAKPNMDAIKAPEEWSTKQIDPDSSISDFIEYCKSNNIQIIPLYPVALEGNQSLSPDSLKFYDSIKQFWLSQGVDFTDSPHESFLEEKYFLNTGYHPTDEGRRKRTRGVIDLIKDEIKTESY